MTQFPKWKYHATEEGQIVESADAEQGLPAGWFDTPAEALAAVKPEDDESESDAEEYRKELLVKAKGLGLNLHHKLGAENILAAIAAKEAENAL